MSTFFEELKRRKVYRVAVAYCVAAGGLIQIASAVFPAWELPNWSLRLTVVLLLIGFPLALILAWAFDVTPQGIQTTPPLAPAAGAAPGHRRRNIFLLIGCGVLASAVAGFFLLPRADATRLDKSIAVLPFENLSESAENAFFADGIQDDILTNLSKIGDLKVISRTSVMAYRDQDKNLRQIGKELGVSAILEGSVRRLGNRVRVSVQLINTENDHHIWADDYDRDLTDVFAIQTDLAQQIARELQARLSPREKERLMRKPTENDQAYAAFREAHTLACFPEDEAKGKKALELYQQAIRLDPKFALAMANLSILHSWFYHAHDPTEARRDLAQQTANRALELAPDLPEAHLARGFSLYYGERDYEGALREFRIAQDGLPNEAEVYLLMGAIQRRQGKWKESTANLEKAVSLNPNDTWPLQNLFFNYQMLRQFDAAKRVIDRALALSPTSFTLNSLKVRLALASAGDVTVADKALETLRQAQITADIAREQGTAAPANISLALANILFFRQRYAEALATLQGVSEEDAAAKKKGPAERYVLEGIVRQKLGQPEEARAALLKAKAIAESELAETPDDPGRHAHLARILAFLHEKEAAIAQAKRAIELLPESVDAFEAPRFTELLAVVYALNGENEKAIELFDDLLSRPSDVTVPLLRLEPALDELRKDPQFEAMLVRHERKT